MSYDLLNDWDDTPEDEKEALLVLKTYHHLIYQLLHMDYRRNIEIIRQQCTISAYFDKHLKSGATPKECNDRILTFLEDRFSRHCEYDEFIAILRKLVDMPHAQTILGQMQKKLNQCFVERRKKEKLQTAGVTQSIAAQASNTTSNITSNTTSNTTSSTTSNTISVVDSKKKAKPAVNGPTSYHQPTSTVTENRLTTSTHTSPPAATDTETSISLKTTTATAKPPSITAGIKAGVSVTTGGAQERSAESEMTDIINEQLHSTPGFDILESYRDLVCDSLPADYNTTADRLQTLIGASDHMIQWVLTGDMSQVNHRIYQIVLVYVWCQPHFIKFCDIMEVLADDSITVGHIKALREDLIRHLLSDGHITGEEASHLESKKLFQAPTASSPTEASGAATVSVIHTNPLSSGGTNSTQGVTNPTSAVLKDIAINYQSVPSIGSAMNAVTTTATISTASQPVITITPNTPLSLSQGFSLGAGVLKLATTTNQSSLQQSSLQLTDQGLPQTDNLTVSGDTSQPNSSLASSENGDSNDDHYSDDMTSDPFLEPDVVPSDNGNQATTSKQVVVPSREKSPVASMQAHSTSGGDHGATVVLTQAGVGSGQSEMNQQINAIVDHGLLSYDQIASFLLSSQQERSVTLMKIMEKVNQAQAEASVQTKPITTSKHIVDPTALAEVQGVFEKPDFAMLKARYAEILACFPESFEATVNVLQEVLDPSQIWEIVSATSGHNQKILNTLILKMNSKEDMLDFCDNLEKIPGAPPLLTLFIEQLRKDVVELLQGAPIPAAEHKPLPAPELALMVQQSSKMSSVSTTSVTTSTDSKPTTSVSPAPTDPPSTSKHGDSDKKHDHPTTFTDDDDLMKPLTSKIASSQGKSTTPSDIDDLQKPPTSKIASFHSTETTMTDDSNLKKPSASRMTSQSESGDTQLDKPAVTSQASRSSEMSVVLDHEMVTQPPTTHQTVTETDSSQEDTEAAFNAFNECLPQLEIVDPDAVSRAFIQTGIISKRSDTSQGAAVHLPSEIKRELIWDDIGKAIHVRGAIIFHQLTTILSETPNCFDVSTQLIDAYDRCKNPLAAAAAATARQHGIHSNFGTLSIASGQLHYSQTPKPSDKLASNNLGMKTPESKTNWLSDDASGTSKRFSNDEKTESENTTKTVPQQVSDSDEATAGSSTYTNKLAAASASTVSSITSTEESVTLEAYNKEVTGVTITTDEMTNNNLPATTTEGGGAPFSSPVPTTKPQDSGISPFEENTAAVATFDEYISVMQDCVDPSVFIPKCISCELLSGDVFGSGVFQTNVMKMEMVLPDVRNNILLNGDEKLVDLIELFRSEPIYNDLANHLEATYKKFKDPAKLKKYKEQPVPDFQMDDEIALEEDPIKKNAALKAFTKYYSVILERTNVDVMMITTKCVRYGVIERSPISGAAEFLTDMLKMEMVLKPIKNNIALNGVKVFFKLVKVFQSMGNYTDLAAYLEAAYRRYEQGIESPEPSESLPSVPNADHLATQQVISSSVGQATGTTDTSVRTKRKVQDGGKYSEKGHL